MKKLILLFCLLSSSFHLLGKGVFTVNTNIKTAFAKIVELRFDAAQATLNQEKKVNPNNLMIDYLENYIDCIKIFTSEDEALFEKLEPKKYNRLTRIEAGDKASTYYYYTQAMMRIHWLMTRGKFGETMTGIREMKKASELLELNKKKFPSFIGNDHALGCIHVMVGAIPEEYNWGKSLLGLSGSVNQGFSELNKVINYSKTNYYLFEKEAIMMTAYLQLQVSNDKNTAWTTMSSSRVSTAESPIVAYVKALVGIYTGHSSSAITILADSKPKADQYPIPQWDYLYGVAKLYRLDTNADFYLNRFATTFKGRHQIKQAYQKLAEHALIHKDLATYKAYLAKGKTKGRADSDGDKEAQALMESNDAPNVLLLKADLLHSGGYYDKSLEILNSKNSNNFSGEDKVQYVYLKARNYQDKKSYTEAIELYKDIIEMPESNGLYYACSAALQMGLMYEKKGMKATAKQYFEKCTNLKSNKYETSFHAKAKAGLSRVD